MVGLCGQISGCVKPSVKRFFFGVLFIHHCKTFIKADQTSSFYPSMNDILYQKYLKKRQNSIATMSFYLKLLKQANKKREYRISEVLPVSSFALAFPVYTRLVDRKQRLLRFSAMHHRMYCSIQPDLIQNRRRHVFAQL